MRAGPWGSRELRAATSPVGSTAHSTQLPLGLLRRLFCQVTPSNWPAGMPLTACVIRSSLGLLRSWIVRRCSLVATAASHVVQMHVHLALRTHVIVSMITHVRCSGVSLRVTSLSDGSVAETASAASAIGSLAG